MNASPRTLERRISELKVAPKVRLPLEPDIVFAHLLVDKFIQTGKHGSTGIVTVLFACGLAGDFTEEIIRADLRAVIARCMSVPEIRDKKSKKLKPLTNPELVDYSYDLAIKPVPSHHLDRALNSVLRTFGATTQDRQDIWELILRVQTGDNSAIEPLFRLALVQEVFNLADRDSIAQNVALVTTQFYQRRFNDVVDRSPLKILYDAIQRPPTIHLPTDSIFDQIMFTTFVAIGELAKSTDSLPAVVESDITH